MIRFEVIKFVKFTVIIVNAIHFPDFRIISKLKQPINEKKYYNNTVINQYNNY